MNMYTEVFMEEIVSQTFNNFDKDQMANSFLSVEIFEIFKLSLKASLLRQSEKVINLPS